MVPVKSSAKQKTHDLSRRKRRGSRVSQRAVAAGTTGPGIFATRAKKRLQVMRRVEGRGEYCNIIEQGSSLAGRPRSRVPNACARSVKKRSDGGGGVRAWTVGDVRCVCVMINPLARQRVRNSCNIIECV